MSGFPSGVVGKGSTDVGADGGAQVTRGAIPLSIQAESFVRGLVNTVNLNHILCAVTTISRKGRRLSLVSSYVKLIPDETFRPCSS